MLSSVSLSPLKTENANNENNERLAFEWNFRKFFSGQMELHFFALRKRNGLNRIIWSAVSDASGPGTGYVPTKNMAAELPVELRHFRGKWFFWRRRRRFHLFGCCSIYIYKEKFESIPWIYWATIATLPMRKDTHCIKERFRNLPPSSRSLAFFLESIAVKSLALVSVDKW